MAGTDPRAPDRLRALLAAVYVMGAGSYVCCLVWGAWHLPLLINLMVALTGTVVSERTGLYVAIGASKIRIDWAEAAVVLGLVLLPTPWLVLVTASAVAAIELLRKNVLRQAAFNVSTSAAGALLAGLTAHSLSSQLIAPSGWVALTLAAVVFAAFNTVAVHLAVATSTGQPLKTVFLCQIAPVVVTTATNVAVAILLLAGWRWSRPSLLLAPILVAGVLLLHRHYTRNATQHDALRRLETASRTFSGLDEGEVFGEVLIRAEELFAVASAELLLHSATSAPVLVTRLADGTLHRRPVSTDEVVPLDVGHTVAQNGKDVTAILAGPHYQLGQLRLRDLGTALSEQERQVLATFAATVASTLLNVRTYQDKVWEAQHDMLTGLANRSLLEETVEDAMRGSNPDGLGFALLLLDLDNFKSINDTLGHLAGDKLLNEVASRLLASVRPGDLVARLGGDEFALVLRGLVENVEADQLATSMLTRLRAPFMLEGLRISVEGSVGVALHPGDADTVDGLLRCADVAMYRAKRRGHTVVRYDAQGDLQDQARLAVLADLQVALDEDQLVLYYQPKIDLVSGQVTGAEALVRWEHPERGLLHPVDFISVVEHSSLIGAFTLHLLDRAIQDCVEWQAAGLTGCGVAVNVSARNLLHHELPDEVARLLARHGLAARHLMLEVTETAMMTEAEICEEVLRRLGEVGVRISVDDFGTGYSSLTFLQRVAVHEVKLDRAFVSNITTSPSAATIVRATTDLAHGLGLTVVAEGVEQEDQLAHLRIFGCDVAQGYLLGRPAPLAQFRAEVFTRELPTQRRPHLVAQRSIATQAS